MPADSGAFGVRGWGRREGLSTRDSKADAQITFGPTSSDDTILAAGTSIGWKARTSRAFLETRIDGSLERFVPGVWIGADMPTAARRSNVGLALDANARSAEEGRGVTVSGSARADAWFDDSANGISSNEVRPTGNLGVEGAVGPVLLATHGGIVGEAAFVRREIRQPRDLHRRESEPSP